jgi:hypothetical protein
MTRQLATCLAIAVLSMISPEPALADIGDVITYDAVDAVEIVSPTNLSVTGIISGEGASTTVRYRVGSTELGASRCDRFAMLAISKPGKFQFSVVDQGGIFTCKIIVRTP